MDEEENANAVSSTWPPPPPFWKDFTPENVSRIEELRRLKLETEAEAETNTEAGADATTTKTTTKAKNTNTNNHDEDNIIRLENLPSHLRNLQPPREPPDGAWRVFGATYRLVDDLPRLEDQGVRRLFPNPDERDTDGKHFDRATILKRLAKSLLLNFLELMGVFATNPGAAEEKITDIRDLFINFHHLINEYRPHQARESLIALMQAQLDRTRAETNAVRDAKEKVERVLEGLGSLKIDDAVPDPSSATSILPIPTPMPAVPAGAGKEAPLWASTWARDEELWRTLESYDGRI